MFKVNAFEEISATTAGDTTSILDVSKSPGVSGRFFALVYVEATGGATGTVNVQVRPKGSAVLVGWIDALLTDIVISASKTSCVADFAAMDGMEIRGIVKTHSESGTINVRIDLGIS